MGGGGGRGQGGGLSPQFLRHPLSGINQSLIEEQSLGEVFEINSHE